MVTLPPGLKEKLAEIEKKQNDHVASLSEEKQKEHRDGQMALKEKFEHNTSKSVQDAAAARDEGIDAKYTTSAAIPNTYALPGIYCSKLMIEVKSPNIMRLVFGEENPETKDVTPRVAVILEPAVMFEAYNMLGQILANYQKKMQEVQAQMMAQIQTKSRDGDYE